MKKRFLIFLSLVLFTSNVILWAEDNGVAHKVLPNGLETFVVENDSVPLVTIMVSFRCGAIAQNADTAGLFHLYEHMLFDGNTKYPTQAAFMAALNKMGVANWNGGTSNEYVNYYITVPADKLESGVEFWSYAVIDPIFDKTVLEGEKQVVINEIRGYHNDPNDIYSSSIETRFFKEFPWRKDISGSEKNIENATVEKMLEIKNTFYIPQNASVLIGGAIKKEDAFRIVEKYFGRWKGAKAPLPVEPAHKTIPNDLFLVFPDDGFYNGISSVSFTFRGPDVLRQTKDTYIADVILFLLQSPVGKFKQSIFKKVPGLYSAEKMFINYPTQRDGGTVSFSTFMFVKDPTKEGPVLDRVAALKKAVAEEFELLAKDPSSYFTKEELEIAKIKLSDSNLLSAEVVQNYLGTLTFWWSTASADYLFSYEKNCKDVSFTDISNFLNSYIVGKPSLTMLRIKTAQYTLDTKMQELVNTYKYEVITRNNAYWWQK